MDERTYGWTNGHRDGLTDIGTDKIQYGDASTHLIRPCLQRINNFQYFYSIKELLTAVKNTIKKKQKESKRKKNTKKRSRGKKWRQKKKKKKAKKKMEKDEVNG